MPLLKLKQQVEASLMLGVTGAFAKLITDQFVFGCHFLALGLLSSNPHLWTIDDQGDKIGCDQR